MGKKEENKKGKLSFLIKLIDSVLTDNSEMILIANYGKGRKGRKGQGRLSAPRAPRDAPLGKWSESKLP